MGGVYDNIKTVMEAKPDIFNHNIETVKRFSKRIRSKATYDRSLSFLRYAKEIELWSLTKSSIMPGFGETKNEIKKAMDDLLAVNVDILTIGQYLPPTKKQALFLPVQKYWHPKEFAELKQIALKKGFKHCESGPLVRSSYHADDQARSVRK